MMTEDVKGITGTVFSGSQTYEGRYFSPFFRYPYGRRFKNPILKRDLVEISYPEV